MRALELFDSLEQAGERACGLVEATCRRALDTNGCFTLGLSGGATPRGFFQLLAASGSVDWRRTHVFLADERCVPAHTEGSNLFQAKTLLLDQVPLPPERIHAPDTTLPPDEAAAAYEEEIRAVLGPGLPRLDLLHLGLGRDGHTASLFPGSEALREGQRLVRAIPPQGEPALARITVTLPLINAAELVFFLLAGEDKLGLVRSIGAGESEAPAALVAPSGPLHWLCAR